jgi:predicted component of type VI protein secretion system
VIYVNVLDTSAYTLAAPLHTAEDVPAPVQHYRDPNRRSWRLIVAQTGSASTTNALTLCIPWVAQSLAPQQPSNWSCEL